MRENLKIFKALNTVSSQLIKLEDMGIVESKE